MPRTAGRDPGEDGRLRGVALAVLAAAAVGIGGWWWLALAPGPVPPARVEAGGTGVEPAPAFGEPTAITEGAGGDARRALPRLAGTVWRDAAVLGDTTSISWSTSTEPGGRYLVQYVCVGAGELHIRAQGVVGGWSESVGCPGPVSSTEVVAEEDRLGIVARRLNYEDIEVAAQLVALP